LRTTFPARAGEPEQRIAPPAVVPLPVVDLTTVPQPGRDHMARRLVTAEARRPFALATGPLLRARLLVLAPDAHVLAVTLHHIVCDGWSLGLLLREFTAAYNAARDGRAIALPPLPLQYADVACWQRTWADGPVLDAQLAYWRTQLADLPVLEIANARRASTTPTPHHGETVTWELTEALTTKLRDLSQREGVTLFMALLAAYAIVLARRTGQRDFAIGVPVANRTHVEMESVIGCFVNTLVIRVRFDEQLTCRALLAQIRATVLDADAHQDVPFERLVQVLRPERAADGAPFFTVTFGMQNIPLRADALEGSRVQSFIARQDEVKYTLSVWAYDGDTQLSLAYTSDRQTIGPRATRALHDQYVRALDLLCRAHERDLFDTELWPLLSGELDAEPSEHGRSAGARLQQIRPAAVRVPHARSTVRS
jgi:hypothetical protein